MKKTITKSASDTKNLALELGAQLKGGQVLGLTGDLGTGKTTFTQGLAEFFNIKTMVTSPTFVIIEEYEIGNSNDQKTKQEIKQLIHIDCYRLNSPQELLELGFNDYLDRKDIIIVIEWADKVKNLLPPQTRWISFEHGKKENERMIIIT